MNKINKKSGGRAPKYPRYQDYVIKDGKFVGEFNEMYDDYADPWEQSTKEEWASDKAVTLNIIQKLKAKRVIELGCGLGHFTNRIQRLGITTIGIDISKTAIEKAKSTYPSCKFLVADILEFDIYRDFNPDIIVMAEITWYVLDKLDYFVNFLKSEMQRTYLIHVLTTYPPGVQQYGKDKFTNLKQIMDYFGLQYYEWGEICYPEMSNCKRTYFFGKWNTLTNNT